ncbi:MAG: hypothetical protein NVSMB62_23820 [Acidobacteriaceae bacterium]
MNPALAEKIALLPGLNKAQLLPVWAEHFGSPPPPKLRKELMVPILAYRMQEREYGGLSNSARRRLKEIAASLGPKRPSLREADSAPQIGTRLVRSWHGEVHEVLATGGDYQYRGRSYSSLSRIAREITGTPWSGPAFFGVRKP